MNLEHPDFQILFDWLVKTSKNLIERQGGFLPHGAIVSPDGKLAGVAGYTKEQQPGAPKALQLLEDGLRGLATKGACRAAGIAIDMKLRAAPRKEDVGKDAIWVILEERSGVCQAAIVPYAKSWLGKFAYSEAFTQPAKPRIFATPN